MIPLFQIPIPPYNPPTHTGWYFDLPIVGERLIEDPLIREGIFIAVTTIPDSSYCSGGGWSIVNEFDALDGSRPALPTFDVTGEESDGTVLINESDKINLTALTSETEAMVGTNGFPQRAFSNLGVVSSI